MRLDHDIHLGYCTNIHRGETWEETWRGLRENTLVIFSSDNGGHSTVWKDFRTCGPLRGFKRDLTEGGIRVPFIARWPGKIAAGKIDNTSLISAVDLLPTFCELAGAKMPEGYQPDGISQVAVLNGAETSTRSKPLYWKMGGGKDSEFHWANYAVVDQQWKLLMTDDGKRLELYDIAPDALETKDLAAEKPEVVKKFVAAWMKATASSSWS